MTDRLVLHGAPTGNCFRAAIGLLEAGLPFEVERVDLASGAQRSEAFRALNPRSKVPVLVVNEGRLVLTQSNAILLFAAEAAPGRLLPTEATARARVLDAFFHAVTDIVGSNNAAFRLQRTGHEAGAAALRADAVAWIEELGAFLDADEQLAGQACSLADVVAYPVVRAMADSVNWERASGLRSWFERIGSRAAFARGLQLFS